MTTRKSRLLTQLGYDQPDNLNTLSDEDALSLFCQNALGEHNFDLHPTLKPHGEAIVKKCDGLPLALIAIGRLLRTKANEEWKELLDSEIWTLRHKSEIAPALIVSYHDLPAYLKQLFAYCSLFPKDYLFDKDELVLLWMAEGFLHQQHGMERLGRSHFNELLTRSFFQHAPNSESLYVMHDLMNDLAESVAGDFSFRFDNEMEANVKKEALEKHRHMSFVRSKFEVYSRFKVFERSRSLRTFLAVSVGTLTGWEEFYLSNKILVELLPQLPLLRVLSLSEYKISEVPESIISLKHLRYLNLSRTRIAHLPEQVGNLYNLQTLLVCGCHMLKNLPTSFFNLKNLRHLDINDTPLLKKMPLGISELKSLQTLPKFIIEGGNGFAITELKDLKDLHGRLHLKGLDKVKSATDAKHANLLEEIDDLEMEWSDVLDGARNEALEGEVLNMLKPRHDIEGEVLNMLKPRHDKLKKLRIEYYGGIGFPSWVGDTSFCRLEHVTISGCKNCTSLPPLGQLPLLKNLLVEGMHGVKVVGSEFLGDCKNCGGDAFPSLENLSFVDMQGWEVWSINSRAFPRIRHLRIEGCRNLVEASLEALPSLRLLETNGCGYGVLRSIVHAASSITTLDIGKISGLTQLHGVIECLGAVEDLNIFECNELRYVWDSEVEAFKILVNLRCLDVRECSNLVGLGEKEDVHCGSSPTSLKEIEIYNCEKLERFKCPNSVEKLQVWQCCNLVSLDVHCGSSLTSLREMSVNGCGKLENFSCPNSIEELMIDDCGSVASISFPTGGQKLKKLIILGLDKLPEVFLNNNNFSSLERLDICWWPNLKSFPDLGYPVHLTTLAIDGCKNLKSFSDLSCFLHITSLSIIDCENLKSFPDDQLLSLTSLTDLAIRGCPNMEESFPRGFWPPNLSDLEIGGLKKPISKWGPQNFPTSLVTLNLLGEDVDSSSQFSHDLLPSSLLYLKIDGFKKLESISNGLQHLTSLQRLSIWRCPMLTDLPMFPQLLELDIIECPKLKERCSRSRRGSCWPRISHIPKVLIDCELWSEHEEDLAQG